MSDYVYVDVESFKITEAQASEAAAHIVEVLTGKVPHNLLSDLRVYATHTNDGSRLEPMPQVGSMAVLFQRSRQERGIAIVDALLAWARARGWLASVVLEGHRGNKGLPPEEVRNCSLAAALASRPKGPHLLRIRSPDSE